MESKINLELLPVEALIESSGKVKATINILDEIRKRDEKVIIFCIYKDSQRLLQRVVQEKFGITPKIINGDTKVLTTARSIGDNYSRQQAIDSFEATDGFNVIIMSPISAGMGLNVTAANNVIHFARHWNPAKESQATDRAYRIGQEKDVNVYYPIACVSDRYAFASFEQTLDTLLSRKTNLADATLFPSEQAEVKLSDFQDFISDLHSVYS
jgi:SNF2 family DNA or RNA helicase